MNSDLALLFNTLLNKEVYFLNVKEDSGGEEEENDNDDDDDDKDDDDDDDDDNLFENVKLMLQIYLLFVSSIRSTIAYSHF